MPLLNFPQRIKITTNNTFIGIPPDSEVFLTTVPSPSGQPLNEDWVLYTEDGTEIFSDTNRFYYRSSITNDTGEGDTTKNLYLNLYNPDTQLTFVFLNYTLSAQNTSYYFKDLYNDDPLLVPVPLPLSYIFANVEAVIYGMTTVKEQLRLRYLGFK